MDFGPDLDFLNKFHQQLFENRVFHGKFLQGFPRKLVKIRESE
jgi:hypothetical protein